MNTGPPSGEVPRTEPNLVEQAHTQYHSVKQNPNDGSIKKTKLKA